MNHNVYPIAKTFMLVNDCFLSTYLYLGKGKNFIMQNFEIPKYIVALRQIEIAHIWLGANLSTNIVIDSCINFFSVHIGPKRPYVHILFRLCSSRNVGMNKLVTYLPRVHK